MYVSVRLGILSGRNYFFLVYFGVFCFNVLFVFCRKSLPATGEEGCIKNNDLQQKQLVDSFKTHKNIPLHIQ